MKQLFLLSVLLLTTVLLTACSTSSGPQYTAEQEVGLASFASCLSDNGATMYGAYWCSHCTSQKELFGAAFEQVNYVECTEDVQSCQSAGISGYPTWVINGKHYSGMQDFQTLSELTGCSLA